MTLLTPPHSRSDKENRRVPRSMSARVVWSQVNEYHSATSPVCTKTWAASASKELPVRSILKQTSYPVLPLLFSEDERQVTPEPDDPLSDLHYLDRPVNKILSQCSTLPDLIEAYSVLTARLRVAVHETTDSNCSWPLFQPIRKRRLAFVDSVTRDLGRALVDPMDGDDQFGCPQPEPPSALPSPEKSPRKRRCGMDEDQVRYARDLVTVSHAVIKFLGLVFTLPAVYGLFDGSLALVSSSVFIRPDWRPSRPRSRFHGYTSACNSAGAGFADAKFAENLHAGNLAAPDAAIARRRSCTSQGSYNLRSSTRCRGRARKRG